MRVRRRLERTAAVALGLMAFAPAGAWAPEAPTRYTLANGCYALQGASGQVVAGGAGSHRWGARRPLAGFARDGYSPCK